MKHPSNPEGILYHSRKNPLLFNLAFFGREEMRDDLVEFRVWPLAAAPGFGDLLDRYEISLV
jgi:hypothetical protein